jgi:hypothetical protein
MKAAVPLLPRSLKNEQSTVESQSLFDITDFERYVVETNGARAFLVSTMALSICSLRIRFSCLACRKLFEPIGELIQLPLSRERGGVTPSRLLAAKAWQRSPSIHRGNRSEQPQAIRLCRKAASSERCFERAISLQQRCRAPACI